MTGQEGTRLRGNDGVGLVQFVNGRGNSSLWKCAAGLCYAWRRMCGRYGSYAHERLRPIEEALKFHFPETALPVRYNIAPSQPVIIVRPAAQEYEVAEVKWGLIPSWSKKPRTSYSTINARAENAAKSPVFRAAFKYRRCLVPADCFYEWQAVPGQKVKQPYCIRMLDGSPFAFAGLWEVWEGNDHTMESCTIMTTDANELMRPIHNRMPVILEPRDYAAWMAADNAEPGKLLKPFPSSQLTAYRVGTRVNSPRNDGPECLKVLTEPRDSD